MKKTFCILFVIFTIFTLVACTSSSTNTENSPFTRYEKWITQTDAEGSSHRWEFGSKEFTQYIVIDGEDTFSQTFNYTYNGKELVCTSDYATLTYKISFNGNSFSATTETGEVLTFEGINPVSDEIFDKA